MFEEDRGLRRSSSVVGTTPGLSQQHCRNGGNQGSDLKKLRERKNAVEQQAGGETEEEEEEDRQIREA